MSSIIYWTNSSTLTKNSQQFCQSCEEKSYYYESFEIRIPENRYYKMWSTSEINVYGFIYENMFDPLNPNENLLAGNGNCYGQFKFDIPLYNDIVYILVVSTHSSLATGNITIHISGLNNVIIKRLSK